MSKQRTATIVMQDEDYNGRVLCHIPPLNFRAYKIPRHMLNKCKDRTELSLSGVYFLFGENGEDGKETVYVGQAGRRQGEDSLGILRRLQEHERDKLKDCWDVAVIIAGESFGHTEISWLEHTIETEVRDANRYEVKNSLKPNKGQTTEVNEIQFNEILENIRIYIKILGYKAFEKVEHTPIKNNISSIMGDNVDKEMLAFFNCSRDIDETEDHEDETDLMELFGMTPVKKDAKTDAASDCEGLSYYGTELYLHRYDIDTTAVWVGEKEFVVKKGSKIRVNVNEKCDSRILKVREEHKDDVNIQGTVTSDITFKSASTAASFVCGTATSGPMAWRTKEGTYFRDLEKESKKETEK